MICAIVIISRIAEACSASSAPKSTVRGCTVSSAAFIAPEQRAAMRGILRRVGDAESLAHRVVQLRGIQPHMRVRQREPMGHQPGARTQSARSVLIRRGSDRLIEQRQQRLRRSQRDSRCPTSACAKVGDPRRVGRIGA